MKNELEIKVNTRLAVSEETAVVCNNLLKMFCENTRQGLDPGNYACQRCVFLNGIYCEYKQMPVGVPDKVAESEDENES